MHEPRVGILVLNYRQPEATLACVRRLLEREGAESRIFWIEQEAEQGLDATEALLEASGLPWQRLAQEPGVLPPAGGVGLLPVEGNLGYAGGNNVGARYCHHLGLPYLWILNNDTLLETGSSLELVRAAEARPEIGLWATPVRDGSGQIHSGGTLRLKDFSVAFFEGSEPLEQDPLTYVSGCSLFLATAFGASIDFIPEEYFLYYEDQALTHNVRRAGRGVSSVPEVMVYHEGSLTTGHRSPVVEYYTRRNRWHFIQQYFPEHMAPQRRAVWCRFQSLFFRGAFRRILLEWRAMQDWKAGRMGRTNRVLV